MNFQKQIFAMAKQDVKTLVFPEASFSDKIINAIKIITKKGIANVILIGDESAIYIKYSSLEGPLVKIINPKSSELRKEVVEKISELKLDEKTGKEVNAIADDPYYFATMLIVLGYADGMVSGTESEEVKTYSPALELLKPNKNSVMSSCVLFLGHHRNIKNSPILITDSALLKNPTESELLNSVENSVDLWKMLFIKEPKIAFLSYVTNSTETTESVTKMKNVAGEYAKKYPNIISDGELQLDVAIKPACQEKKYLDSKIKGDANILVVPDATSGNILSKSLQLFAGLKAVGPISLGFSRPVGNISRNATVSEIVLLSAVTAVQSQTD